MASFQDLINSQSDASATSVQNNTTSISEPVALSASYSIPKTEEWIRNDRYVWYDDFSDSKISYVDELKNIKLDSSQVNLSQEELSQFILFEMPRRYDNFDIALNTRIQFHYVNANKDEDYVNAVNVQYTNDRIQFALLVPYGMTHVAGNVPFEIIATGTNSKGENYKWISRSCKDLNVIASLSGNGIIDPTTTDWYTQFVRDMDAKIVVAQTASQDALDASKQAINAATQAQNTVNNAKTELQKSLNESITTALSKYYTKKEVDALLKNIDLTSVYEAIDNIDGLAKFDVTYNTDTRIITFYNGEDIIKSLTINSNPTTEWVTAYDAKVDSKISEATSAIQKELKEYKDATDTNLESIHSDIDGLPQTLATDYYNKEATDALLQDKADKNTVNTLSTSITAIESTSNTNKI